MTFGLGAIFLAGLLTLVTPCILPMLPVYFTLLLGEGANSVKSGQNRLRLVTTTLWFVLGFGLVFVALGLAASVAGSVLTAHRGLLLGISGAAIALFGAKQLGFIRVPWLDRTLQVKSVESKHRWLNGLLFGFTFALGWTPCVGPILGSVLTFAAASSTIPWHGALMLAVYAAGIGFPLLVIALAVDRMLPLARSLQRSLPRFEKFTGAAMIAVGIFLMAPPVWNVARSKIYAEPGISAAASQNHSFREPSERPRVVEFYSSHCPTCEKMAPLLDQLRQDCRAQGVDVVQVDVSDPNHRSLASDFGVRAVPAFHLFEASGRDSATAYGEHTLSELRALASELIDAPCAGVTSDSGRRPSAPKSGCTLGGSNANAGAHAPADILECNQGS